MIFTDNFLINYADTWDRCAALQGLRPKRWLEIGVWEGRSACWMMEHKLAEQGEIVCVDPLDYFPEQDARATANLTEAERQYGKTATIVRSTLPSAAVSDLFDGCYIDGPKEYESCLETSRLAWDLVRPGGVLIWDDIHWHEDQRAHDEKRISPVGRAVRAMLREKGIPWERLDWHTTQAVVVKPKHQSTRCVCNVAFGEVFLNEQIAVHGNHRAYAEKCGADFIEIKGNELLGYGCAGKLAVQEILDSYDQTLYLDCDVIVTKRAPIIFDEVPLGYWAGVSEFGCVQQITRESWQSMADTICDAAFIPRVRLPFAFNGGVGVMPRGGGWILEPPNQPTPENWIFDQLWWSIQILRWEQPYVLLDRRYNANQWMIDPERTKERGFFIHQNDAERMTRHLRIREHIAKHGL